ncbi:MAG: YkgJ family cysteine cluster protein [Desulfovibrio sp.]
MTPDPSVCKRCALEGPTCCRLEPGQEEFCFPLSDKEKERIQDFQPDEGGFALQENTEGFLLNLLRLFPAEHDLIRALFPPRKFHFRLAVDEKGACRFLGRTGCRIPSELRPYYCRLYPFWVVGGRVNFFDASSCLARREAVNLLRMYDSFGLNAAQVRDLMGRLRLAWGLPPTTGMQPVKRSF